MHIFKSNVLGLASNTRYPHEFIINDKSSKDDLKNVFNKDYVCATYKYSKRGHPRSPSGFTRVSSGVS